VRSIEVVNSNAPPLPGVQRPGYTTRRWAWDSVRSLPVMWPWEAFGSQKAEIFRCAMAWCGVTS